MTDDSCIWCDGTGECPYCAHVEPGPCPHCHGLRICGCCAAPRSARVMSPRVGVAAAISPLDAGADELERVRYLLTGVE